MRITFIALAVQDDSAGKVLPSTCVCSLLLHMFDSLSYVQFVTVDDVRILRDIGQSNTQSRQRYLPLMPPFLTQNNSTAHRLWNFQIFYYPCAFLTNVVLIPGWDARQCCRTYLAFGPLLYLSFFFCIAVAVYRSPSAPCIALLLWPVRYCKVS